MNEEALNQAFEDAKANGYGGTREQFVELISTNQEALNLAHKNSAAAGYGGNVEDFSSLLGLGSKVAEDNKPVATTTPGEVTLPQVTSDITGRGEGKAVEMLKNRFSGLGFEFEEAVPGLDYVKVIAPDGAEETFSVNADIFGFATGASDKMANQMNDFIKAHADDDPSINSAEYSNGWSLADTSEISFKNEDGSTKTIAELTSDELLDHTNRILQKADSEAVDKAAVSLSESLGEDTEFLTSLAESLKSKHDISTQEGQENFMKEFNELFSEEVYNRLLVDEDLAKTINSIHQGVGTRFGGVIKEKVRVEKEDAVLSQGFVGSIIKDLPIANKTLRGAYITGIYQIPQSYYNAQALKVSTLAEDAAKELKSLEGRADDEILKFSGEVITYLPDSKERPDLNMPAFNKNWEKTSGVKGKYTVGERRQVLENRIKFYEEDIRDNIITSMDYQKSLNDVIHPTIFGESVLDPDLTLDEYWRMIGTQGVQMLGAILTMGGSTYMQEGGGAYFEIVSEIARDKMFPGDSDEAKMQKWSALNDQEKADAMLDIVNKGEANTDAAVRTGFQTAGLDLIGNAFVLKAGTKFLPKDMLRKLLDGNFKKFLSQGWKSAGKELTQASLMESITESLQEVSSITNVGIATGDFKDTSFNIKRISEAAGQAFLTTPFLITGGNVITTSVQETISHVQGIRDPESVRGIINKKKEEIDALFKAGEIDKRTRNDLFGELEAAEQLVSNRKLKNLDGEEKGEVIDNLVEQTKLEEEINALEENIKKTKKEIGEENYGKYTTDEEIQVKRKKDKLQELKDENKYKVLIQDYLTTGVGIANWVNNKNEGIFKDKKVVTFETVTEAENYIKKNKLQDRLGEEHLKRLLNGDVNGANLGDIAILVNDNVRKNIREGDWSASNVAHHEILHFVLDGMEAQELDSFIEGALKEIRESNDPKMQEVKARLFEKLAVYEMQGTGLDTKIGKEEFFTSLSDALNYVQTKDINIENGGTLAAMGELLQDIFRKGTSQKVGDIDFSNFNAENTLKFLQKYNDFNGTGERYTGRTPTGRVDADDKEREVKESVAVKNRSKAVEAVNAIEQEIKRNIEAEGKEYTKEEFQASGRKGFDKIYNTMLPGGAINNYIRSLNMSPEKTQKTIEAVTDRLINYDPKAERKVGGTEGVTIGEFLMANVGFGKLVAAKELAVEGARKKQETRIDAKDDSGRTVAETIAAPKQEVVADTKRVKKAREIKSLKDITLDNKDVISSQIENKINDLIEQNPENLIEQIEKLVSKDFAKAVKAQMGAIRNVGGKVVVSEEYKAHHALNYQDYINRLDVTTIKKKYNQLFDIEKIGEEQRVTRKSDKPGLKKDSYYRKGIFNITTTKAKWTKYFTEGGYTTLLARQRGLAEFISADLTAEAIDKVISEKSNDLSEVLKAELRLYNKARESQKSEKLSFDTVKLSAVVKGLTDAELANFYENLPLLSANLKIVNVRDQEQVMDAVKNIYGDIFTTGKTTKLGKEIFKLASRYGDINERHVNVKTKPEQTLNEYLYDNLKAAELEMNLAQYLDLKDDAGKFIQLSKSFDNIDNINRARAEVVAVAKKLINKYGKEKAFMMLVHASGMYATSSKISRGNFTVNKEGVVVEVILKEGESFGSQRYQVFDSKKDFVDNVIKKVFSDETIKTTKKGSLSKFQNIDGNKIDTSLLSETSKSAMSDKNYKARKKQAKISEEFVKDIAQHYKDQIKKGALTKEDFAMLMMSMGSNMQSPLKRAANLAYIYKDKAGKKYTGELRYEHMIPTNYMVMQITNAYMNDGAVDLDALFKEYTVAVIPATMDKILENMGLVHVMPVGYRPGESSTSRYYNMSTFGHPDLYAIESLDPNAKTKTYGENVANIKFSESMSTGNQSLIKAIRNSRIPRKPKGITVLDFDDTLATTRSNVLYTTPDGVTGKLNAEEFAKQGADLLAEGYTFDFSEFNKVVEGKTAPLFAKAQKLAGKFGTKNMFILTARAPESQAAIKEFLDANGLVIPIENITGLGNSTAQAKADWIAGKVAEGYNDFYFADDAIQNVKAVKNMLNQFDVKSKVQQAKVKFSESMNVDFNKILEEVSGIDAAKRFSDTKARKRGKDKGKFRFFVPPSHEDFVGLLYNFMGKGEKGNAHRDFFEKSLLRPLNRANRELDTARQAIANDYKKLNKSFPDVKKKFNKEVPQGDFTFQDAIRVYLWDKHGHTIPGLSKTDQQGLVDLVKNDQQLQAYAEVLNRISKLEDYVSPSEVWEVNDIRTDLEAATGRVGRAQYFEEFINNADIIFSKENLNKIEAAYGKSMRDAIEDMLYRIKTGRNRPSGTNAIVNEFVNFINGAVGSVMFFNMRSAVLQQMSIVNYINFADNNMLAAAKAFANQKQYWTDWAYIFNSADLKQRRGGIQTDVNGAELASKIQGSRNPFRAAVKELLRVGFTPTQIADSMAIATGGATFYRNRVNLYIKKGLNKKEAENKAWEDFLDVTQTTQQSARPDMVSQQQASPLGKFILAFQNVTSQFNRVGKKAFLDLKNRRKTNPNATQLQNDLSNVSRVVYYLAVQNLIFYALQSALFATMFDDDEDDEKLLKKKGRMINGSIDSVLRGTGVYGAVAATLKNMVIKQLEQREKPAHAKDESAVLMEMLNVSPPLGIKARQIVNAEKTLNYNKKEIEEMETFDIDNPQWSATASYIQGVTNIPTAQLYRKTQNVREALNNEHSIMNRILMFSGWSKWNLDIEEEDSKSKKKKGSSKKQGFGKPKRKGTLPK